MSKKAIIFLPCDNSKRSFGGYNSKFLIEVDVFWYIKL